MEKLVQEILSTRWDAIKSVEMDCCAVVNEPK